MQLLSQIALEDAMAIYRPDCDLNTLIFAVSIIHQLDLDQSLEVRDGMIEFINQEQLDIELDRSLREYESAR